AIIKGGIISMDFPKLPHLNISLNDDIGAPTVEEKERPEALSVAQLGKRFPLSIGQTKEQERTEKAAGANEESPLHNFGESPVTRLQPMRNEELLGSGRHRLPPEMQIRNTGGLSLTCEP